MKPIIQEDLTGCGIAISATIVGISYHDAKRTANKMGIYTDDQSLWSNTIYVRRLLSKLGVSIGDRELPFHDWDYYLIVHCFQSSGVWNQASLYGIG